MDKVFVLVISMWGNTGSEWEYIGNQIVLNQDMSQEQCEYMASEDQWTKHYEHEYYKMELQCYPKDCGGLDQCD